MKTILVTGGTVFVSQYVAEYYVKKGYHVYVLNRNTKTQPKGVTLIQADRHALHDKLKDYHFDIILDITAYTAADIHSLLDAVGSYSEYVFISSSAVYPEYGKMPFTEEEPLGANKFWGMYGTDKIEAEHALLSRDEDAYIIRPPYLYGPMNDVYREAFVFDCALQKRDFYLPKDGQLKLQFFHVDDLCRFIDAILNEKPKEHIFNVGNKDVISIKDWVRLCYHIVGTAPVFRHVTIDTNIRNYFCFADYEYSLDLHKQDMLMTDTKPLEEGLRESFEWYLGHQDQVEKRPYIEYIDAHLKDM